MKNKKRTKTAGAAALVLAVMLTAAACGANDNDTGQHATESAEAGVNDQLPEGSGIQDPGSVGSEDDSQPEETAATGGGDDSREPAADLAISGEGVYTGQIDSNSIEIQTDQGAVAYRITKELAPAIEALPTDAIVIFDYTEKVIDSEQGIKQLWLTKIEVK